jgi:hypothetical protein
MRFILAFCFGSAIATAFALSVSGCSAFDSAFPVVVNVVKIVADDIAAGDTEAQLASDVCKALGGTTPTDAVCADVAQVIADALGLMLKDAKTPAATRTRALVIQGHIAAGSFGKP